MKMLWTTTWVCSQICSKVTTRFRCALILHHVFLGHCHLRGAHFLDIKIVFVQELNSLNKVVQRILSCESNYKYWEVDNQSTELLG